jgi:hypothetical protein
MRTGAIGTLSLAVNLVVVAGNARADDHNIATVVPEHVFMVRGFSVRNGDWFVLEPSVWFARGLVGPSRPIVLVVRPMLGVGGAGVGVGLAPTLEPPWPDAEKCAPTPDFWLPVSLEAHVERMYGATPWRHATYVGPQLSLSAVVLKASIGWMVDASDRSDGHLQVAIGGGF